MQGLLLAAALVTSPGYTAKQGETLIIQLSAEQCASELSIFGRPHRCEPDNRLIIGIDFEAPVDPKTKKQTYCLEGANIPIEIQDAKFDTAYRRRRTGKSRVTKVQREAEAQRIATALSSGPGRCPGFPADREFSLPLLDVAITDEFGLKRMYYAKSRKAAVPSPHRGVDLRAKKGTPVITAGYGMVVLADTFSSEGNMAIVYHGSNIYSLYMHLAKFNVLQGQMVNSGDVIAYSGDTGAKGQPHLHFAIKVSGATVDPLKFIETFNASLKTDQAPVQSPLATTGQAVVP